MSSQLRYKLMVLLVHYHNILQVLALKQVVNYENIAALFRICGSVMIVTSDSKFLCVGTKFLHFDSYISTLVLILLTLIHWFHSTYKGKRLRQTINKRGTNILRVVESLSPTHTYLTSTDYEFLFKFTDRTSGDIYLNGRKLLKLQIKSLVSFYQYVNKEVVFSKSSS